MRNLKRALSLLLSSTMVLGMLVMGSSAAGYKDVDASNKNQEAIEVLQAVGVMSGVDNEGNFDPDGSVTRNQMAVIMAHLLKLDYDYYRGTNPFTDVPDWAAPYVAACAAEGVIAGIGNNQFGGDMKVTAAQASLMIMKALGYFQNAEDFGTDWQVATIRQASYINLFANINSDADSALTRAQVAQLVLNGLKAQMVDFTGDKGIQIGDVTVGYRAEYTARTNANKKYNSIDTGKTDIAGNNQYYVQLGEELYNGDLKLADNEADVFGRPAHTWSFDGEKIGTYVNYDLMVKEYTTAATGKELYEAVGKTAFDKYDFESYVNGKDSDLYKQISKDNKKEVTNTADGALTQVFVDSEKEEVIVTVINTYLAQATMDYNEKKDSVSFKIYGLNEITKSVSGDDFAIADISKDDFVLVTYADDEIQTISDVEILSKVEISTFSTSGDKVTAVTVDGTKYNDSAMLKYNDEVLKQYANTNLKDTTYNVYLDQYGYVIGVDVVEGVDNYVFITGVDGNSSNLATANFDANAIFMDGTSQVIKVKNNGEVKGGAVINKWYTYTKNSSDVYTLNLVEDDSAIIGVDDADKAAQAHSTAAEVTQIDKNHVSLKGIGGDARVYGNDESIYLLAELDRVKKTGADNKYAVITGVDEVVTGIDNASFELYNKANAWDAVKTDESDAKPADANISFGAYTLYDDNGYVIASVVVGESSSISSKIAYVNSDSLKDESYDKTADEWTRTREVIINGEAVVLQEVRDDNSSTLKGLDEDTWYTIKYDANGNVKDAVKLGAKDNYVTGSNAINEAVKLIEKEEDTIVVTAPADHQYTLKGSTLYDNTDKKLGFRVDSNVNIVLMQTVKNKTTTEYYTGIDALDSILNELNEVSEKVYNYTFHAVIENGRATSVIIDDHTQDTDYQGPDGGSSDANVIKLSSQNNALETGAKIELKNAVSKDTTYEVQLQMMNNDGDWRNVDTIKVLVKSGDKYGFTPITGISGNQQYRLVYGELTALLSK